MRIERDEATGKPVKARIIKPDDFHQHVRDDAMLDLVVPMVARRFRSAIIMPNLVPPITDVAHLVQYKERIQQQAGKRFLPLMTLYLTDTLDPAEVRRALQQKLAIGIKYYPRGLTTNSDSGVKNPRDLWTPGTKPYECLKALAEYNGVFLIHAADGFDKNGDEIDPYDQESHFLTVTLPNLAETHSDLKMSIEHLSTAKGADQIRFYGRHSNGKIGCSLTAHHLLLDRRDVFRGGFHPHRSWMPAIQSKEHKEELRKLASEDHPFVWLGSDSAPHSRAKKESACCASGVLMAHAGIELYAEAFEDMNALDDRFERFASVNGRKFYDLPGFFGLTNEKPETIELVREEWTVPALLEARSVGITETTIEAVVYPFRLGETIRWKLVD